MGDRLGTPRVVGIFFFSILEFSFPFFKIYIAEAVHNIFFVPMPCSVNQTIHVLCYVPFSFLF